jgi:single-stranded-DNA-specific exonuclease
MEGAQMLDMHNRERQTVENLVFKEAEAMLQTLGSLDDLPSIVLGSRDWHPGVVGIVASRLKEKFNRPSLVAGVADGVAKGSGRSVTGLDLGAAVLYARAKEMLLTGGGHAMAAGFSLDEGKIAAFHAFLDERLAAARAYPSAAELVVEGSVAVPGCTLELAEAMARLAPFGAGNAEPTLVLPRVRLVGASRVGKEKGSIRAFVEGEGGGRLKAIMFRAGDGPLEAPCGGASRSRSTGSRSGQARIRCRRARHRRVRHP